MSHHEHNHEEEDDEWTPRGAVETFNGFEVWDHGVFPTDLNHGVQDPEEPQTDE